MLFPVLSAAELSGNDGNADKQVRSRQWDSTCHFCVISISRRSGADAGSPTYPGDPGRCIVLATAAVLVHAARRGHPDAIGAIQIPPPSSSRRLTRASWRPKRLCDDRSALAALGQLSAGLATHELRNPPGQYRKVRLRPCWRERLARRRRSDGEGTGADHQLRSRPRQLSGDARFPRFRAAARAAARGPWISATSVIDRAAGRSGAEDHPASTRVSLPRLAIDPELMEQVFLNLVTNAAQASKPGDPVTIRTRELNGQAEIRRNRPRLRHSRKTRSKRSSIPSSPRKRTWRGPGPRDPSLARSSMGTRR